ncbi:MAG TPA: M28 family peptidase [Gemmatimonadaceae bacterium]|nr:M28 family peptidase [Gemmatimonadaceae bacterium]
MRTSASLRLAAAGALLLLAGCERFRGPRTSFSGDAAYGYTKAQVAFGPRVPGTPAHRRAGDWILDQMRTRADTVIVQSWTHVTAQGDSLPLRNFLARVNAKATDRVLYLTHWDTRPTADEDPTLGNRRLPIPGANDGASGVGLLMALADALKKTPPNVGVDLLFVDGEDYGDFNTYSDTASNPDVLIGSTYFASHLPSPDYKPLFGVLWDMIGDAHLQIFQESISANNAPEVVTRVWGVAKDLGYGKYFIDEDHGAITDDHVPLIRKGLRVIDVIDIDYCTTGTACTPPDPRNLHHTLQDTMDKVSAKSLQIVGDVATALVTR